MMSIDVQSENKSLGPDSANSVEQSCGVIFDLVSEQNREKVLSKRRKFIRRAFGKTKKSPFLWGVGGVSGKDSPQKLIQRIHRQFWETKSVVEGTASNLANKCSKQVTSAERVGSIALVAYGVASFAQIPNEFVTDEPSLQCQLQEVELPLWNAVNADNEFEAIAERFEELTERMLDGDGWPEAEFFGDFGLLAASWLRCALMFEQLEVAIDAATESRLDWLTRQLTRSARNDGSLFFDNQNSGINCKAFAKLLADLSLDTSIKKLLQRRASTVKTKPKAIRNLPVSSSVSEWAQVAVLRESWDAGSPAIATLFAQSKIDLELAHKFSVIAGIALLTFGLTVNCYSRLQKFALLANWNLTKLIFWNWKLTMVNGVCSDSWSCFGMVWYWSVTMCLVRKKL